jgi:enoyl-CoA hydratase/carnithine racemase
LRQKLAVLSETEPTLAAPPARLRSNAQSRRNAVSHALWRALPAICARIEARAEAHVVVVEGAGGRFSAGADASEFAEAYRDALATHGYVDAIQTGMAALAALDRPTIAALSGVAVGGGLALALCCDLRFCAEDAHLAITAAKLGLLYGHVETRRLVELVGPARAKDLLFSGRRVEPAEALAIGLVDRLVAAEALARTVDDYAADLARLSQTSIRGAKRAVDAITRGMSAESAAFRAAVEDAALSEDFREGRAAFAAKRAPRFSDRGATKAID